MSDVLSIKAHFELAVVVGMVVAVVVAAGFVIC